MCDTHHAEKAEKAGKRYDVWSTRAPNLSHTILPRISPDIGERKIPCTKKNETAQQHPDQYEHKPATNCV